MFLSLVAFDTLSLLCKRSVFPMPCCGDFLLQPCLFGGLYAFFQQHGVSFLSLGKFFAMILLKRQFMPLIQIIGIDEGEESLFFHSVPHFLCVPFLC